MIAPEIPYRLSRFAHLIRLQRRAAVYHSLFMKPLFVELELADRLENFRFGMTRQSFIQRYGSQYDAGALGQLFDRLVELSVLITVDSNEMDDLIQIQKSGVFTPQISGMYVMLTDLCNLNCGYCFVESPLSVGHQFTTMDPEVAVMAIDRFVEWSNPDFLRTIIFCGGEPLLNIKTLEAALIRIDFHQQTGGLSEEIKLQLITNGVLIDESFVELAQRHKLKVSVSIDGKQEFHDQLRKNHAGRGTHQEAVRGFKFLQEKGIPVGVSMTIGQHHLGHLVENVSWLIDELGIKSIGFNTLMDVHPGQLVADDYVAVVNQEMIEAFKILRERGVYEDRIMRKVSAFTAGTLYPHDCAGCGKQIVISPKGTIGVCHGYPGWEKYFVEPSIGFDPRDHSFWKEWARRSPLCMPQCFDCPALGICGGGCIHSAEVRNGSIWSVNEAFCIHTKTLLNWMLEEVSL